MAEGGGAGGGDPGSEAALVDGLFGAGGSDGRGDSGGVGSQALPLAPAHGLQHSVAHVVRLDLLRLLQRRRLRLGCLAAALRQQLRQLLVRYEVLREPRLCLRPCADCKCSSLPGRM